MTSAKGNLPDHYKFTPVSGKKPFLSDWPDNPMSEDDARKYHGATGCGILHKQSGTCCIDIDDLDIARRFFKKEYGINIDDYLDQDRAYIIKSPQKNRRKALFKIPFGKSGLEYVKRLQLIQNKPISFLELRAGHGLQDVIPGSEYYWKDKGFTGEYYEHEGLEKPPELPKELLKVWMSEMELMQKQREKYDGEASLTLMNGNQQSVIHVFNLTYSVGDILSRSGYTKKGQRYLSPNSESGIAGVVIFLSDKYPWDLCYSHHASDGDIGKRAVDAFELAAYFEGKNKKEFAQEHSRKLKAIDPETGEIMGLSVHYWNERNKYLIPVPELQELADELFKRQRKKSYLVAVVFTLIIAARATAGKYFSSWQNTPAAIYAMFVGPSGIGKELLYASNSQLYDDLPNKVIKGAPNSGNAYISDLQKDSSATHLVDEFGEKLNNNDKHFSAWSAASMEIYGRSGGVHYCGSYSARSLSEKDKKKLEAPIRNPCPNLIAITTWPSLTPCLTDLRLVNGYVNRFIPFMCMESKLPRVMDPETSSLPNKLITYTKKVADKRVHRLTGRIYIEIDDDAKKRLWEYSQEMDDTDYDLLSKLRERRFENALRLCTILAAWDRNEQINLEIVQFVIQVMKNNCGKFDDYVLNKDVRDTVFDKAIPRVLMHLDKAGGKLSHTELDQHCSAYKNFKFQNLTPAKAKKALRAELEDRGLAEVQEDENSTAKKKPLIISITETGIDNIKSIR